MTLKELQNMIKEEFDAYMGEQEDEVDVSVSDNDIDAEMGDDMGDMDAAGEEDVLRKIYDLLAMHFEGGEEEMGDEEMPMDDVEGEEAPEADLEEFYPSKAATTTKSGALGASGYKNFSKSSGHTGFGDSKSLNEGVERMKKLANIIK